MRRRWLVLVVGVALGAAWALVRRRRRGEPAVPPDLWKRRNLEGTEAFQQGDLSRARDLFREALELLGSRERPDRRHATCLNNLGAVQRALGEAAEAEACFREALAIRERLLGEAHPLTAQSLTNLADHLRAGKRPSEAEPLYRRALAVREAEHGSTGAELARSLANLGGLLVEGEANEEAVHLLRRLLELQGGGRDGSGPAPERVTTLDKLAMGLRKLGRLDEAVEVAEQALELRDHLPDMHTDRVTGMVHLALCLEARGDRSASQDLYQAALNLLEAQLALLVESGEEGAQEVVRRRLEALRRRVSELA